MHWHTFERLLGEHKAHVEVALIGMAAKLGVLHERFE